MTQNQRLIEYLADGKSITPLDSWKQLGIMRLASRINELKNMGYPIKKEMVEVQNQFGEGVKVASYSRDYSRSNYHYERRVVA